MIVYAGTDPVTGKEVRLRESTKDPRKVEAIKTRLPAQVDSQRNAPTNASLGYVIDRWMAVHEGERSTLDTYRGHIERTIKPALGDVPASRIRARNLEEFYAELRRCGVRCAGKPFIEHRTSELHECRAVRHRRPPGRPSARWEAEHDCDVAGCTVIECQPHVCRPMARSTVRQIHAIISGALSLAVRWEWIPSNPAAVAEKPKQPAPEPEPPTAEQAAWITEAAWDVDLDWGTLVWLAMVTGARRGELASLRWSDTVEVIVGGVLGPITRPEVVIAGRYTADGELVQVGRTVPLSAAQSRELAAMLEPGAGDHPWPDEIGNARWAKTGASSVPLTKVAPSVVVEVSADAALAGRRLAPPPAPRADPRGTGS